MPLDDRIAAQRARIEQLQEELSAEQKVNPRRPLEFRLERAAQLRTSLQNLERAKSSSIARFDREIAAVTEELARLETPTDLDAALRRLNYGGHRKKGGSQAEDNEL
jgi:hypothetical protein